MAPPDDLTGKEPSLGGDMRPARKQFAPWPYPKEVADLLDYYQTLSTEAAQHSLITLVDEALHPHLMAAAIATVRDPSSLPNLRRSAAALLDIILTFHWVWQWVTEEVITLLHAPRPNTDYFVEYYVHQALTSIAQMQGEPSPDPPTVKAGDIEVLIEALQTGTILVRQQAAAALGTTGDIQAALPLYHALADEEKAVRENTIRALGALGARIEDSALRSELFAQLLDIFEQTPHARLREAAADALGAIGIPTAAGALVEQAVARLAKAVEIEASYVQEAAVGTLGRLGTQTQNGMLRAFALTPLIVTLEQGKHYKLRYHAADALGEAGAKIDDEKHVALIVQALIRALQDSVPDVRYAAACALGQIGAPAAVTALTETVEDRHPDVSARAAAALDQIRAKQEEGNNNGEKNGGR